MAVVVKLSVKNETVLDADNVKRKSALVPWINCFAA